MKRLFLSLLFPLLCAFCLNAQSRHVSSDYQFINYLVENRMKEDALSILGESSSNYLPSDTLSFLRGWTEYNFKLLSRAASSFSEVPSNSVFFDKATYYGFVCSANCSDLVSAKAFLDSYPGPRRDELYYTELAGLSLLKDDPQAYAAAALHFLGGDGVLGVAQSSLAKVYDERYCLPQKSPWRAGLYSALLPGSGYWYAGNKTRSVFAFLGAVALGCIVAENNIHYGPSDWRSILWDVAGAGYYIGNVCGSVGALAEQQRKRYDAQTSSVLYNIHIPLRSILR